MTASPARPIRRSPLEGLTGRAASTPAADADITLVELGPLDKAVARGIGSVETAARVVDDGPVAIWHLGADESIVVYPPEAAADADRVLAGARSTVDVSSGHAVLRLGGRRARALLAEACPVDLSEHAVPDRGIVQAPVANVRVVLARIDLAGQPAFTLLVARDEARYLWDALCELGGLA